MFTKFLTKAGTRFIANPALFVEAAPFLLVAGAAILVYELVTDNTSIVNK